MLWAAVASFVTHDLVQCYSVQKNVTVVASSWVAVVVKIMQDNLAQQGWPLFPLQLLAAPVTWALGITFLSNEGMQIMEVDCCVCALDGRQA